MLFRALASGSSGNAYVLRTPKTTLLFEAGLRLSTLSRALATESLTVDDLSAVLVSHEHRDHCIAARDLAAQHHVPICANDAVLRAIGVEGLPEAQVLDVGRPALFGDVEVTTFPVAHDAVMPVGYLVRHDGKTMVIATDLGNATPEVTEAVAEADLLVLEANHDTELLYNGRYPYHLRRRVSGPTGHLSNNQAATVLVKHVKNEDVDVWLAHLSKENNTPTLALKTVKASLRAVGLDALSVGVALRDRPSLRWTGQSRPRQLSLFGAGSL